METSESEKHIYKLSNEFRDSICDIHRRELGKLNDIIGKKERKIKELETRLAKQPKETRMGMTHIQEMDKLKTRNEIQTSEIKQNIYQKEQDIKKMESKIQEYENQISEYKKVIQDKDEQFERERNDSKYCLEQHKEKITKDINTIQTQNKEITELKRSLSQNEKALQSAENKIKKLNTNIEEYKSSLSQKEKALQSAENKIKKLNTNIEEYKSREETEIMRYQEMVSEKDIVIRDTKKRLTEAAQINLASGHHTRVENTEFIVRPSTLAADYNEFTDGQRMDAIDLLQKKTKCDELASELIACEIMKLGMKKLRYEQRIIHDHRYKLEHMLIAS
uniref:Myosin-3-like n=1 Tax=Saccoglossus kowalevskii TaxID=10224 RepID=A0ABM0MDJ3_SACKO|nr:PREDICTED: myosin-3-like [Saccoglossus kowalevskii]